MAARSQFQHSRLKVHRANRHIHEINSVFQSFLQTDFCKVIVEIDPQTGYNRLKVASVAPVPIGLSLCIGDAVHNLRSSLDYITTHFVGKDDNRITFPVHKERKVLVTSPQLRTVQEASPELATFILDKICPHEGGDFKIWELSNLDNFDKHKLLIPVVSIQRISGICAEDENENRFNDMTGMVDQGGHVNMVITSAKMKITNYGKPAAAILFPKGAIFEGKPIIPTLVELLQLTLKAIEALETFCFGDAPDPNPA